MEPITNMLRLLKSDEPEVRCATALVLGRLRPVEPRVLRALQRALASADASSRSYFLDGLAATDDPAMLPDVLRFLEAQGSLGEQAVHIVRKMGRRALPAIRDLHRDRDTWISGAFIKAVAGIPGVDSVKMILERLDAAPWDQARAVSIFLREHFDSYPVTAQRLIRKKVAAVLSGPVEGTNDNAVITSLKLAGGELEIEVATEDVVRWTTRDSAPAVRRHAYQALAARRLTRAEWRAILPGLVSTLLSRDRAAVGEAVLELIGSTRRCPLTAEELRRLATCRHAAVVDLALHELARRHGDEAGDELVRSLDSPIEAVRSSALAAMRHLDDAHAAYVDAFGRVRSETARLEIIPYLVGLNGGPDPSETKEWLGRYVKSRLAGEVLDKPLLFLLAGADREGLNEALVTRARRYLREDRAADVIALLQPVVRWRHATEEARFQLALANLELASAELDPENPNFERCISILAPLARTDGYDLAARMHRSRNVPIERWLGVLPWLGARGARERRMARKFLEGLDAEALSNGLGRTYRDVAAKLGA